MKYAFKREKKIKKTRYLVVYVDNLYRFVSILPNQTYKHEN